MRMLLASLICCVLVSCKKDDDAKSQVITKEKLAGTWNLISEMRKGLTGYPERYVPPGRSDIKFTAEGKAYPTLEGQVGLVYDYNLNAEKRTMIYGFVLGYLPYKPMLQEVKIIHLSERLLVIEQSLPVVDMISGATVNLYLKDSLSR